jgi:hypothetical protein
LHIYAEEKEKEKKNFEKKYMWHERKRKKKWINVPFPNDLGGCFEVKAQKLKYLAFVLYHTC